MLYQLSYRRLRIISDHTTRIVVQPPTYIRRGVQYEYVPILEIIFRIVLLENAFDSRIIMIIAFKLLPQNMYGTSFCLLNSLDFLHTYTSFSHGFTATKIYPCVRRNIIMSFDNYIFSVLSAKKS